LLFGVLAMQMNFVTREALIAAVSTWVLDKSKPLDRILVEQGALGADERDLLEPLIHKSTSSDTAATPDGAWRRSVRVARPGRLFDTSLTRSSMPAMPSSVISTDASNGTQIAHIIAYHGGGQRGIVICPDRVGGIGK